VGGRIFAGGPVADADADTREEGVALAGVPVSPPSEITISPATNTRTAALAPAIAARTRARRSAPGRIGSGGSSSIRVPGSMIWVSRDPLSAT
jgi:hypothetical protein